MADDINLLPDNLRGQEDKHKGKGKKPAPLDLTDPEKLPPDQKRKKLQSKPDRRPPQSQSPDDMLVAIDNAPYDFSALNQSKTNHKSKAYASAPGGERVKFRSNGEPHSPSPPSPPSPPQPKSKKPKASKPSGGLVNFIPPSLKDAADIRWKDKLSLLGLVVILALIVVGVAYSLILWYQIRVATELQTVEMEIRQLTEQIEKEQSGLAQAQSLQRRLAIFDRQFRRHLYWSNFFEVIEDSIAENVFYTNLDASSNGIVTIQAVGRGYKAAAEQLVALQRQDDIFSNVFVRQIDRTGGESFFDNTVSPTTLNQLEDLVSFQIEMVVNTKVWRAEI